MGFRDEWAECEAEAHLATAMAAMHFEEDDDDRDGDSCDFAVSESSAEFFFSRRASMDELSEPGFSAIETTSTRATIGAKEFAQKHIQIGSMDGEKTTTTTTERRESVASQQLGKETPRVRRKGDTTAAQGPQHRHNLAR